MSQNRVTEPFEPLPDSPLIFKQRYLCQQELGRGGFGVVYLALDRLLEDRPVVIKVLHDTFDTSQYGDWFKRKFQHELQALARLRHPGIVAVLDRGELADGQPFIVMEYIEGITLSQLLKQGALTLPHVAHLLSQISRALDAAHAQQVYHRDLKPENVMLQPLGRGAELVKLIDFGIATVKDAKEARTGQPNKARPDVTEPQTVVAGTLRYMAPEQLRGKPTAQSDIFALGVIVYEMLTGQTPFQAETPVQLYQLQSEAGYRQATALQPALPPSVDAVLQKALAFDPALRYASAQEFAADLARTIVPTSPSPSPSPAANKFYIVRPTDAEFLDAIARRDSIVLVKGARQMGKTSLLARGLQQARANGARVVITDLQTLNADHLKNIEALFMALADAIADQLELEFDPARHWRASRGPSPNFARFIEKEVLGRLQTPLVWALDEVDRLFACPFGSEVFGLFRSWYNRRALDPTTPWQRLTLAIAYATEAHLFITDVNQSPFNVGTRLTLADFTLPQVEELNRRYQFPLRNPHEAAQFYQLVGGQPYLTQHGLKEMAMRQLQFSEFLSRAELDDGPYGEHLRRMQLMLTQDAQLHSAVRAVINGQPCPATEVFYRLRSAGVVAGEVAQEARLRCRLYANYLRRHL